MTNLIALIVANVKEFFRNKISVILLIVFPLLLILVIFLSFNTAGITKISGGIIIETEELTFSEAELYFNSFIQLKEYQSVEECNLDLKKYKVYVCMRLYSSEPVTLDVYYDNTREPIIWEILGKIKTTIDIIQNLKSTEIASTFLSKFSTNLDKLTSLENELDNVDNSLDLYIDNVDDSITEIGNARSDLSLTLDEMDQDIGDTNDAKKDIEFEKNVMYSNVIYQLDYVTSNLNNIDNLSYSNLIYLQEAKGRIGSAKNGVEDYNSEADESLDDIDSKINSYEQASANGRGYVSDMGEAEQDLSVTKNELYSYKIRINQLQQELNSVENEFQDVKTFNPELLVNPIVLNNFPLFTGSDIGTFSDKFSIDSIIPSFENNSISDSNETQNIEEIVSVLNKGQNLLAMQIFFPKLLFLITLFLSLLISAFMTLRTINSPSHKRIRLLPHIFFPSFLSAYLSSLIIMLVPVVAVIFLGEFLFMIPIFGSYSFTLIMMFLLSSIFILLGMFLAYLIEKESITLLVSTFLLVFMIFFSGFLLPMEKMNSIASSFVANFPPYIVLNSFNKLIFYGQSITVALPEIILLIKWFVALLVIVLITKKLKKL
jgi:conjugal transfer/entry exclusion protein